MALHLKSTGIDFADFGSDGGMSSELMDDYEEGTFTHSITDGTSNMTLDMPTGSYQKIASWVTVGGHIRVTAYNGVSGGLYLGNFPYTVAAGTQSRVGGACSYSTGLDITASENYTIHTNESTTRCMINLWNSTGGTSWAQHSWFSADGSTVYGLSFPSSS